MDNTLYQETLGNANTGVQKIENTGDEADGDEEQKEMDKAENKGKSTLDVVNRSQDKQENTKKKGENTQDDVDNTLGKVEDTQKEENNTDDKLDNTQEVDNTLEVVDNTLKAVDNTRYNGKKPDSDENDKSTIKQEVNGVHSMDEGGTKDVCEEEKPQTPPECEIGLEKQRRLGLPDENDFQTNEASFKVCICKFWGIYFHHLTFLVGSSPNVVLRVDYVT